MGRTLVGFQLVGGLEHLDYVFVFHHIGNFRIPTDELIFFGGVGIPPTSWSSIFFGPGRQLK